MHLIRRAAFRAASTLPSTTTRSLSTRISSPFRTQAITAPTKLSAITFRRFASDSAADNSSPEAAAVEETKEHSFEASESGGVAAPYGRDSSRPVRSQRPPLPPNKAIYIGNLQFDVTEADLKSEFEEFGTVTKSTLAVDPRGLSKGFGYIEFETIEAATAAIEARNQSLLAGRRMIINYQSSAPRTPKPSNPKSKTLFIGNMAFEMSDADLNKLFRDIRNVIDVRVAIDRRTGQPRGFAHADFTDVESAEKAMEFLQHKEVYGRSLRVDFSAGKTPRLGGYNSDDSARGSSRGDDSGSSTF